MKRAIVLIGSLILVLSLFQARSQNVGIGVDQPQQKLEVDGAIKIGSSDQAVPGTIRWTGSNFQGFDGTKWVRLDLQSNEILEASGPNCWEQDADTVRLLNIGDKVGVGTSSPDAKLDVDGTMALRNGEIIVGDGTSHNVALPDKSMISASGPANTYTITGFTGGCDGRILYFHNNCTGKLSFRHLDPGSSPENQIICPGETKTDIKKSGTAMLIYSQSLGKWLLVNGD